jgi:uncharacterized protein
MDRSQRSRDTFGRLRVETTNISKANVCPYLGREIPGWQALGLDAAKVYQLWRHPDELKKAAASFNMVPVMDEHVVVDAANPELETVAGTMGNDVRFEYPYLKGSMAMWVGDSIDGVQQKRKRQLSCGYGYRADMTPGKTPDGVAYDGVMRDIMGNHVALVREGRAGPDVMVADELPQEIIPMKQSAVVTAVLAALGLSESATVTSEQKVALDEALDAAMCSTAAAAAEDAKAKAEKAAYDADPEAYEDDPEKPGKKRRKAKKNDHDADDKVAGKDKTASGAAAPNGPEKGAPKPDKGNEGKALDGVVSKEDAEKLAADAATAAAAAAVAAERALVAARSDVAEVVGAVALDSAEAVYRYALKDQKVAGHDTIHESALAAVWSQVKAGKTRATQAADAAQGSDAASMVAAIGL